MSKSVEIFQPNVISARDFAERFDSRRYPYLNEADQSNKGWVIDSRMGGVWDKIDPQAEFIPLRPTISFSGLRAIHELAKFQSRYGEEAIRVIGFNGSETVHGFVMFSDLDKDPEQLLKERDQAVETDNCELVVSKDLARVLVTGETDFY